MDARTNDTDRQDSNARMDAWHRKTGSSNSSSSGTNDEYSDQLFTFDDIEEDMRVVLRGREGYVTDKGDHVLESSNREHIEIRLTNVTRQSVTNKRLHEDMVNRYLAKGTLWVDWSGFSIPGDD